MDEVNWKFRVALERWRLKRLARYRERVGNRREWYELGFKDGWEARGEEEELTKRTDRKGKSYMAKKSDEITQPGGPGAKSGRAGKSPLHEGPAGAGPVARSKFNKETRDSVGEKEPGKSRGAGG